MVSLMIMQVMTRVRIPDNKVNSGIRNSILGAREPRASTNNTCAGLP